MRWRLPHLFCFVLTMLMTAPAVRAMTVVIVKTSDAAPYTQAENALRQELTGQNCHVTALLARDASDKGIETSIGKPDVVVAVGTAAARWLHKQLPPGQKLIYCMAASAEENGLLQGSTAMGVTTDVSLGEEFKLVAEALPQARCVGLMYRSDAPGAKVMLRDFQAALPAGWRVEPVAVNEYPSVAEAIEALSQKPIDIAWTTADQKLYDTACVRSLLLTAVRKKVPVWGYSLAFVRAGALLGVGVDPADQGKQAAAIVKKILKDPTRFKPQADPPERFQIGVNLIVAEQIGVEMPAAVTQRAACVFQPEK